MIPSTTPSISPVSTLQLHNTLVICLYANIQRDPPASDVAPWVVATDKPAAATKATGTAGANDKAEERLKREVMALHARDRRRIKTLKADTAAKEDGALKEMLDYQHQLDILPPDIQPQNNSGLGKTNYDIEIRRKYAQPLAAETLEFPSLAEVSNRIEPICYEEGLVGGAQGSLQSCAELVEQAAEVWIKELLTDLCAHSRSDGEGCIQTAKYRRQLRREEDEAERGILQRNAAGLLPVELDLSAKQKPLNGHDLRLALQTEDRHFRQEPFLSESIMLDVYPEVGKSPPAENLFAKAAANGTAVHADPDAMAVDEAEWGWQGGTKTDTDMLMGVLDDCLAVA